MKLNSHVQVSYLFPLPTQDLSNTYNQPTLNTQSLDTRVIHTIMSIPNHSKSLFMYLKVQIAYSRKKKSKKNHEYDTPIKTKTNCIRSSKSENHTIQFKKPETIPIQIVYQLPFSPVVEDYRPVSQPPERQLAYLVSLAFPS